VEYNFLAAFLMIPRRAVFWKLLFSLQNWVAKQGLKSDYYSYAQPEGGE
jgi:hypothetical protein